MKMDFDTIVTDKYGIMLGNKTLIFVKTGRGGSCYGYNNKYLNLANEVLQAYGYSVVISAYPPDTTCNLEEELEEIKTYINDYEKV